MDQKKAPRPAKDAGQTKAKPSMLSMSTTDTLAAAQAICVESFQASKDPLKMPLQGNGKNRPRASTDMSSLKKFGPDPRGVDQRRKSDVVLGQNEAGRPVGTDRAFLNNRGVISSRKQPNSPGSCGNSLRLPLQPALSNIGGLAESPRQSRSSARLGSAGEDSDGSGSSAASLPMGISRSSVEIEKKSADQKHWDQIDRARRKRLYSLSNLKKRHDHILKGKNHDMLEGQYLMLSDMVMLVRSQMEAESSGTAAGNSMVELMTSLRLYTQELMSCDRCSLFIKVRRSGKYMLWTMLEDGSEISIPLTSGLAGACVTERAPVRTADAKQDPRFNPEVDRFTGYTSQSILCTPVFTCDEDDAVEDERTPSSSCCSPTQGARHEDILGVLQVINKIKGGGDDQEPGCRGDAGAGIVPFTAQDESVLRSLASMSAVNILVTKALESERKSKDKFATLGAMAKVLLRQSTANVRALRGHIQSGAASLCQCQHAILYTPDASGTRLQAEDAEGAEISFRLLAGSRRKKQGMFFAGKSFRTGKVINIADVEAAAESDKWGSLVEMTKLGLKELHALLAVPIEREGPDGKMEIIGVLQVINKTDSKGRQTEFELDDILLLEGLCVHVASALTVSAAFSATASPYKTVELAPSSDQWARRASVHSLSSVSAMAITRVHSLSSVQDVQMDELSLRKAGLLEWNFDMLGKSNAEMSQYIHPLFDAFDLSEDFRIEADTLKAFSAEVSKGYFDNPFHSYAHAWTVTQACMHMLWTLGDTTSNILFKVDLLPLFVAALCHDIGHPGTNNSFQQKICSPLAMLYNDESILENHHAASCFQIMCSSPDANVLGNLSKTEFRTARRFICSSILSTDMSRHERDLVRLRARLGTPLGKESEEDRQLTVAALLHSADLSNPTRPAPLAEAWARRLAEEFQLQAEKERDTGVEVSTFMLGGYRASTEIFFIQTFVKPLWETMAGALPPLKFYVAACNSVLEGYKEEVRKQQELSDMSPNSADGNSESPTAKG